MREIEKGICEMDRKREREWKWERVRVKVSENGILWNGDVI